MAGLLLVALLLYLFFILRTAFVVDDVLYFTLVDDAMISMRYADNFAAGQGLVWNVGEDPIQGFTNLGWTLFMAVIHLLSVPAATISLLVMITGAGLLLANAMVAFFIVRVLVPERPMPAVIAAGVVAFYFPLVFWSLRGTEVGIATLIIQLAALQAIRLDRAPGLRGGILLGLTCLAAVLVRMDLGLQIALVLIYLAMLGRVQVKPAELATAVLLPVGGVIAILAFQATYFDSIFPNTYYLKVEGVSILERLDLGLQVFLEYASRDILLPLVIALAGIFLYPGLRSAKIFLLLGLFAIQCLYSVYLGGDYAEPLAQPQVDAANRFITQGMPFLVVVFAIAVDRLIHELGAARGFEFSFSPRAASLVMGVVTVITLVTVSGQPWARWAWDNAPLLEDDISRAKLGLLIKDSTDEKAVIAVHAAGQIPYFSERRTIDLLGKSDSTIAYEDPQTEFRPGHNKWNYEYSINGLKPDLVADEWGDSEAFLSEQEDYSRLENGIYVRNDSPYLALDRLAKPYQ